MTGIKHDKGKPRIDLVPPGAIFEVAEVLTDGVEEYGAHNWREGIAYSRLYAAIQRHLLIYWMGGDIDQSGHRALAHACTDIMMLMEMPPEWDDRYKPETHADKNKFPCGPVLMGCDVPGKLLDIKRQRNKTSVDTRPAGMV